MTRMPPMVNTLYLPWSVEEGSVAVRQNQQFVRWLRWLLGIFVIFGIVIPMIPVPMPVKMLPVRPAESLARVTVEVPPDKPKAPPVVRPVPKPGKPQPVVAVTEPAPVVAELPVPTEAELAEAASQRAKASGLLKFQDQLNAMREMANVDRSTSELVGDTEAALPQRQLVGRRIASRQSLPAAALATSVEVVSLPDQATSKLAPAAMSAKPALQPVDSGRAPDQLRGRADAEIRKTIDRNKGAIFAIYNRALRSQPQLRGKLAIKMVIAPDGSIVSATLVASDLGDTELENRLLTRIRMITFGAANVAATTLNYSFEFLPG